MPDDAVNNEGPLSGYRIIDVTQMLSGPMATMMLGDQGADVIKVEPTGVGDPTRGFGASKRGMAPTFAVINRNKRSIAIDLKDHRGLGIMKHLIAAPMCSCKTSGPAAPSEWALVSPSCGASNRISYTFRSAALATRALMSGGAFTIR